MEENGTKISNEDVELDEDLKKEAAKGGEAEAESSSFFSSLVTNPFTLLLSLFLLPALWCVFVGIGWSKEDKVEDSVYEIWTRQRSELRRDEDYAEDLGRGDFGSSSFLAMAIARDGGNLMTSDRLETIRARMQETEEITVRLVAACLCCHIRFLRSALTVSFWITAYFVLSCCVIYVFCFVVLRYICIDRAQRNHLRLGRLLLFQ